MKTIISKFIGFLINVLSLISSKLSAKISLIIFSTPIKGKIKEAQFDFLDTAFKEELSYNDMTIRTYRWIGENKTILLVHGWESNASRWKNLIIDLQKLKFNIIALDAPAHGLSGSKRFNAILYSEFINVTVRKFDPEIIIGHSVGGMASVFYQHKYQNTEIEKLVLLGAPSNFTDVFKRYVDMMGYNKRVSEQMNQLILERYGNLPEYYSAANFTKSIDASGLIIHDEKDAIIPFSDAKHYKSSFINSQLITTQGFGHSLSHESITSHIIEFITE